MAWITAKHVPLKPFDVSCTLLGKAKVKLIGGIGEVGKVKCNEICI